MSTLKTTVRGLAAAGLAAGVVVGAAAPAAAEIVSITYDFDVVTEDVVEAGSIIPAQVTSSVEWEYTEEGDWPTDEMITLTPDDSSVLYFAASEDDPRCSDVGDGSVECSEPGPYPEEGDAYLVAVAFAEEATEESDLGFTATGAVAQVEPSSKHYTFVLGETAAVEDEEEPEEPTEEPSEDPSDDAEPKPDEPSETEDETLPTTGADSTMLIAGAAAALVVGAGAIFLLRRRKLAQNWE